MSTPWSYWWTQDFGSVATEMDLREPEWSGLGFVVSLARCRVVGSLSLVRSSWPAELVLLRRVRRSESGCVVVVAVSALSVPFRLFGLHIGSLSLFLRRSSLDLSPVLGASARRVSRFSMGSSVLWFPVGASRQDSPSQHHSRGLDVTIQMAQIGFSSEVRSLLLSNACLLLPVVVARFQVLVRLSFRKAARHHSHLAMLVLGQAVSSA
ncbi:hypothetical protein YC2023_059703 [Brassica napus]